jgi:spermidine synthase
MIRLFLFVLGMTAMATQIILIRESLAIFHGNELIIGLFLGIWMILTAAGAILSVQSSKFKVQSFKFKVQSYKFTLVNLLLLLTMLPLSTLFTIICLRFSIIPAGIMPGLGQTTLVLFLALLPFCMISGMLFPVLVKTLSNLKGKNLLHEGYALDSAGSIFGGLLFSMLFIFVLPPYESLLLLTLMCLVIIMITAWLNKMKYYSLISLLIGISLVMLDRTLVPARFLDKKQFQNQEVLEIKSSPHGLIAMTRIGEQLFIYENGIPVSLGEEVISREEPVHYAMLLHPSPEKVLIISGAANGSIEEAMKYSPSVIDYVDRNPWLLRMIGKSRTLPQDGHVSYFYEDARIFLNKTGKKYDVVILNISDPESAEMNRYYTVEFYKLLKDKLNNGGIISVSTQAAGNYMNETSRMVHSVIFNTLKSVFSQVRIIPGGKDYFLASESTIEQPIFTNYESRGINNDYVNPYYINETLLRMRSDMIMKDIQPGTQINSDLKPYVFSLFLKQWMARFKINSWLIPLILILLLILSLFFLGPLNLGLFAGGFTASGLEFILLIWFQVIFGYVYQMTGVIFALFMAGMAIGSFFRKNIYRNNTFRGFLTVQGAIAAFSAIVAAFMFLTSSFDTSFVMISLLLLLVFITGLLTGIQFSLSAHLRKSDILISSGESFSADLLGSAIGVIMISVFVIPLIGLPMTALSLAGLNVVVLGVIALKGRPQGFR